MDKKIFIVRVTQGTKMDENESRAGERGKVQLVKCGGAGHSESKKQMSQKYTRDINLNTQLRGTQMSSSMAETTARWMNYQMELICTEDKLDVKWK